MARTTSSGIRTWYRAAARRAVRTLVARVNTPPTVKLSLALIASPVTMPLMCAKSPNCAMAGGPDDDDGCVSAPPDPIASQTARRVGLRGVRPIARPPVVAAASMSSHNASSGKTIGVPSIGLEIKASPMEYRVWLHEARNALARSRSPALSPPLLNRSVVTSACADSINEKMLLPAGMSWRNSTG